MDIKRILMRLTNLYGGSGNEFAVSEAAAEMLSTYMDEVSIDGFGNVTGVLHNRQSCAPKVLIDAHLDQMSMLVTGITEEGFLRFSTSGFDPRQLYGADLVIKTSRGESFDGLVTTLPKELQSGNPQKTVKPDALYIDTGFSADRVKASISIGDYIYYANETEFLAGDMFCGKAIDDRAGMAIILSALDRIHKKPLPYELYVCFTAREEVGGPGAALCGYRINPDLAIAIDGGQGQCYMESGRGTYPMDAGALIGYGDHSMPVCANKLIETAERHNLPYVKVPIPAHSKTNAGRYQSAAKGLSTAVIEFPMIYAHSSVEMTSLKNLKTVSKLIACFLTDSPAEEVTGNV